ncbi:hypothetical protein B0H14DRAFT_3489314 [Mycena olivaceomarginata]|nr:hypothetical protein B0H14DRAFT_3489314 [Mycena olivaceomarginata]
MVDDVVPSQLPSAANSKRNKIPHVVRVQVDAAVALYHNAPTFFENIAPTPDQMDAEYPPGRGGQSSVVHRLRWTPAGFYVTFEEAEDEVNGVPCGYRRRVAGRIAALAYYRQMYDQGKVRRLNEEPEPLDELSQPV